MNDQQNQNEAACGGSALTARLGVPAIHLAFSDNGEHIRFWTASEGHAREWARENWETEPFFSGAQMAAAQAKIEQLRTALREIRDCETLEAAKDIALKARTAPNAPAQECSAGSCAASPGAQS